MVHTNFGVNSYGPIIGPYLFLGEFVWTNGPESSSKVSPYTGIGPWTALPRKKAILGETLRKSELGSIRGATLETAPHDLSHAKKNAQSPCLTLSEIVPQIAP